MQPKSATEKCNRKSSSHQKWPRDNCTSLSRWHKGVASSVVAKSSAGIKNTVPIQQTCTQGYTWPPRTQTPICSWVFQIVNWLESLEDPQPTRVFGGFSTLDAMLILKEQATGAVNRLWKVVDLALFLGYAAVMPRLLYHLSPKTHIAGVVGMSYDPETW